MYKLIELIEFHLRYKKLLLVNVTKFFIDYLSCMLKYIFDTYFLPMKVKKH